MKRTEVGVVAGGGDMSTSSSTSFIAWVAAVSASVAGVGVGWLQPGNRVFQPDYVFSVRPTSWT